MLRRMLIRLTVATSISAISVMGQYPGMPGMPGSSGGYTPPKSGYSSSTGIAIGAAAAAGVGVSYFVLHNRGRLAGCLTRAGDGETGLIDDNGKNTYSLINSGSVHLTPGERVALKGKRIKDSSGKLSFEVHELAKDYGPCKQ